MVYGGLRDIRRKYKLAYNGIRVKTETGEIGVICGGENYMLKIYIEGKKTHEKVDPERVAYLGFTIK